MKHKFKTFILVFGLVFGFMMNVHADATVKEDASTYEGDVYIIGSSRFDSNTIITGTMATVAGAREAYIQYAINQNEKFKPEDVKIYYYSELAETWSVLPATSKDEIKELTEEEAKTLTDNLKIYYVNEVEKVLEVPYNVELEDGYELRFSTNNDSHADAVRYEDGKIILPATATWVEVYAVKESEVPGEEPEELYLGDVVQNEGEFKDAFRVVRTYEEFLFALNEDVESIQVDEDIELTEEVVVSRTLDLVLNGSTISASDDFADIALFKVVEGGYLSFYGNGTINSASQGNNFSMAVWAKETGKVEIYGLTFTNVGAKSFEDGGIKPNNNELIYASGSGTIIINGGQFIGNTTNETYGAGFTLNLHDGSRETASIVVNGGRFIGFNPANNKAEGEGTNFLSEHSKVNYIDEIYDVTSLSDYDVALINGFAYPNLETAVVAAKAKDTVKLLKDTNGNGIVVDKELTIDLNGFTYTIDGKLVGSANSQTNGFQLLKDNKVTIKNGVVTLSADAVRGDGKERKGTMLVQNYSDLTLEDVTLNGAADTLYVLSHNNGTVSVKNSIVNAQGTHEALALYYWPQANYGKINVSVVNSTINGIVGYSGDSTTTPAILEANSVLTIDADSMIKNEVIAPTGYEWKNNDGTNLLIQERVAYIEGREKYSSLEDAVAAAEAKDTVKLLKDTNGNGIVVDKELIIDLNGFTYTIDGKLVGSANSQTNGFQLLKDNKVTIKNGVVTLSADAVRGDGKERKGTMLVQNYSDLTLEDVTLNGAADTLYVLSHNNGPALIKNSTVNAQGSHEALALYYWPQANYGKINVSVVNSTINGMVGYSGDSTTTPAILEENIVLTITNGIFTDSNVLNYATDVNGVKILATPETAQQSINNAVDGTTIELAEGNYDLLIIDYSSKNITEGNGGAANPYVTTRNLGNFTITGNGANTKVNGIRINDYHLTYFDGRDSLTIGNGAHVSTDSGYVFDTLTIKDMTLTKSLSLNDLRVTANNVVYENVVFDMEAKPKTDALSLTLYYQDKIKDVVIKNSTFKNTTAEHVIYLLAQGNKGYNPNTNVTIENNKFYGGIRAVMIAGTNNGNHDGKFNILNNEFKDTTDRAIRVSSALTTSSIITVVGNTFTNVNPIEGEVFKTDGNKDTVVFNENTTNGNASVYDASTGIAN